MNAPASKDLPAGPYIQVDRTRGRFLVDKRAFMDQAVFERERNFIFNRCWLYVGHESEVREPGTFLTRQVGGYNIIFNKDRNGKVNAFHNLCTHRGTLLTTETCGKARVFTCPYHGWVFGDTGELLNQNTTYGYGPDFNEGGFYNLHAVARLEQYRGFYFLNMNPRAISLEKYLADTKEWIDLIVDPHEQGLEVTPGAQEFHAPCNWKSISENQIDSYHGISLHSSYFQYARKRAAESAEQQASTYVGKAYGFGNGHAGFETTVRSGKPSADWIPAFGEETRPLIEAKQAELVKKWGPERGMRMATSNRNMLIFPNTILNDVMSLSVRTSYPLSPTTTLSNIWNLAPVGEDPLVRKVRLQNHLTFVGPGGFAHPDDYEMFERRAIGDQQSPAFMHDYSKGMVPGADEDPLYVRGDHADEGQQRAWWTQWDRVLRGEETFEE
ncbi:MAG: aromatic ring-hydroxylating dioxygenase subunit alpha [Porticoccaceae bacterium]